MSLLQDPESEQALPEESPVPCATCGVPMAAEQDWCLECGTAKDGRLGKRPGARTALAAAGATLLLAIAAISVGYAALTDDAGKDAGAPSAGDATPIAQANPDVAPQVSTIGPTAEAGPTGVTGPLAPVTTSTPSTTAPLPTLPQLPGTTPPPAVAPPVVPPPAVPPPPAATTPTKTTTTTKTTPTTPTPTPITLGADDADLYDPYARQTDKGDPANSYDANAKDPWFVTTAADGKPMNVGLLIDLESRKTVKQIAFATTTPGFRVELYTTDGSALPSDILDTRWTHITDRSKVDENTKGDNKAKDGIEIIKFPGGGEQVRQIVLWFTAPPGAGATVRLRNFKAFG